MTVLEKVQDIVKAASDKTSEVIEISRLRAGIAEEKHAINVQEAKLGAIYYEMYKNGELLSPEAVEICMTIDKSQNKIAEKEAVLAKINEANAAKKAAKTNSAEEIAECPECGFPNPAGAKFCSECGAKIPEIIEGEAVEVEEPQEAPEPKVCPECGTELRPEQKFCNECGSRVSEQ